jgi:hypothetical protein
LLVLGGGLLLLGLAESLVEFPLLDEGLQRSQEGRRRRWEGGTLTNFSRVEKNSWEGRVASSPK